MLGLELEMDLAADISKYGPPTMQRCVYCGSTENLTAEHAPPKLLFPKPLPSDLITVPACEPCNSAGSKCAEYFRLALCFNPLAKNIPSVIALKPTVQRSLLRPQASGFKAALLKAIEPVDGRIAIAVDMGRIHLVVRRIVQCLYLHETGTMLPIETHESRVASVEMLQQFGLDEVDQFRSSFIEPLANQELKLYANSQFAYSVIHTSKPFVSVWSLLFYGILPFIGFTSTKVQLQ